MLEKLIADLIATHGNRPAVADRHGALTYAELGAGSARVALALDSWTQEALPGARRSAPLRVALCASNSTAYVETYIGLLAAGAVPFLMDPSMGPDEIDHLVESCSLDAIVHDRPLPPPHGNTAPAPLGRVGITAVSHALARRVPLLPNTEVCRFTSGSTGFPHCIEFSGAAVHAAAQGWVSGTGLEADDRVLCFAGLANGLAFNTSLLPVFLVGASVYLTGGLPNASTVIAALEATRATRLTGFPALYDSLMRRAVSPESVARLRVAISAGARLNPETAAALKQQSCLTVSDYYGIAETGPLTFDPEPGRHAGLGLPLPGVELRCTGSAEAPAEISATSPSMGSRYLNAPGVFESRIDAHGFYRTGDNGYLSEGRLVLVGRNAHVLNVGGRKVDPVEVRRVLTEVAGVDDALVFATSKAGGEEMVVALVASGRGLPVEPLRAACLDRLAAYKVPERIYVVPALPVNSIGKPRLEMARQLVEKLQAEVAP